MGNKAKIANIELSMSMIVRMILGLFLIIFCFSLFTDWFESFLTINPIGKILAILMIIFIMDNVNWILIRIGMMSF